MVGLRFCISNGLQKRISISEMIGKTYTCLRSENEWNWSPSYAIENDKQIDRDDGEDTVAVEGRTFYYWIDGLIDPNIEHGKGLSESTDDQAPFSAESVIEMLAMSINNRCPTYCSVMKARAKAVITTLTTP